MVARSKEAATPPPMSPIPRVAPSHHSSIKSSNTSTTTRQTPPARSIRRYYIDELGFYRHLDPEQKQYVCSNINATNLRASDESIKLINTSNNNSTNNQQHQQQSGNNNNSNSNHSEGGYEICFRAVRHDLGISHFDRTEDYENWKNGWDQFMRIKLASQQPVTLNRELKDRIRSGIPHDYRCKVWSALIRMRTKSIRATFGEDIYQVIVRDFVSKVDVPDYAQEEAEDMNNNNDNNGSLKRQNHSKSSYIAPMGSGGGGGRLQAAVDQGRTRGSNNLTPTPTQQPQYSSQRPLISHNSLIDKCFKQIELDLLRTLPNNRHFENPNSRGIQRVRRVLRAYACFNSTVGYCQGMNRLAAMALLVLPEEEAFWCLVAIIQCIMPKDYYLKPWLAQVDCCVLSDLLEKKMPKLHKHLARNDIQLTLFTWFFTIFVDGFRPELMLRIWDCFLLEGDKVLFRFALAILYLSQEDLLEMNDFSTMSSHLNRLVSTRNLDMEQLFDTRLTFGQVSFKLMNSVAFNTMNPLSSGSLQARREFHRNRMQSMMEEE